MIILCNSELTYKLWIWQLFPSQTRIYSLLCSKIRMKFNEGLYKEQWESIKRVIKVNIKNNALLAAKNHKDEWRREEVFGRLKGCNDLVSEEAVYYSACMAKFSKKTESGKVGYRINEEKVWSFVVLCEWLDKDGDCELYTL